MSRLSLLSACMFLAAAGMPLGAQPTAPQGIVLDRGRMDEPENLDVFHDWMRWNNGGSQLINHMVSQAATLYDARQKEIDAIDSQAAWIARQRKVSGILTDIFGPFPVRSPLRAVVTGVIRKQGYRVEKIVYESRPDFFVTGCLFIPDGIRGKVPAVLNLIGHEQESFRAPLDQVIILNLVKKGMVVFTIDPLGQGEHLQYFDPKINFSSIGYSVVEHCYFGNQCFLSGFSSARHFLWDGMRAIDYLLTRREVDAANIGVTGFSGGGTVTSYLGAMDARVKVAVPSSWSVANRMQLETKGAQDAEATLVHSLRRGITFEDLIEVRAPKPTLMTFVTRDEYLSPQGARDAYAEAAKAFRSFGREDHLQFVEDDSKHWLTPKIRVAIYGFFMKHFGLSGDASEQEVALLTEAELKVTRTGQVATSFGGEMVFDVNKKETAGLLDDLERARQDIKEHLQTVATKAKEICGYIEPAQVAPALINGRYQRDGYSVSKCLIAGEGRYAIPILLFEPSDGSKHPAVVYLHPMGKKVEAHPGGEIEKLVKKGYVVAATDVLGVGETENTAARGLAAGYTGVLTGRSVVGIQAGDIVRVVQYLKTLDRVDAGRIGGFARGGMCFPLVHAAAFDASIRSITLTGAPVSYRSIVMNRFYKIGLTEREGGGVHHPYEVDFSWGVAGVLRGYDLPDLIGSIAPRKVALVRMTDQMLEPASQEMMDEELGFSRAAYTFRNAPGNFKIAFSGETLEHILDWAFE